MDIKWTNDPEKVKSAARYQKRLLQINQPGNRRWFVLFCLMLVSSGFLLQLNFPGGINLLIAFALVIPLRYVPLLLLRAWKRIANSSGKKGASEKRGTCIAQITDAGFCISGVGFDYFYRWKAFSGMIRDKERIWLLMANKPVAYCTIRYELLTVTEQRELDEVLKKNFAEREYL